MKSIPDPDTTPTQKYRAFEKGLRRVLECSKDDLLKAEKQYRAEREKKPKRGPKPRSG
jgi:hypothetical protein